MKKTSIVRALLLLVASSGFAGSRNAETMNPRERLLMDFGWRFAFGHSYDAEKDFRHGMSYFSHFAKAGYGDGPASPEFDDRAWRKLDLPHDWAVELPFNCRGSHSHGYKTIGRRFPDTSVGWYRKSFVVPETDLGRRISIEFDGVHRDSTVWVNGFYLGTEQSGYYGFRYDITDYLRYGDSNVVAVRVDATVEEGWYYEGAGIYRHVWLNKTSPLHVAHHGTFVSSEIRTGSADVTARTKIVNAGDAASDFDIEQDIVDSVGMSVATGRLRNLSLAPGRRHEYSCLISVPYPKLWSIGSPYLYKLITTIRSKSAVVDRYETIFGMRSVRFDPNRGFFLNGRHVKLRGTNNHQDHAGVGTAMPDALQEFRVERLKEMGGNAYRCSHNPPGPELLDACDRLGMLVIDEHRLMGSNRFHLDLLERMIQRDRNHPSVVLWSLGNEEWAIEGNVTGARITSKMQEFARRLDPTRRVNAASSGGWGSGISSVIDVMGFNYIANGDIDKQHAEFPHQPGVGTEEATTRATRGVYEDDPTRGHMAPSDRKPSGRSIEEGIRFYAARPFLAGLFFWTGFDYRGEANPFGWPQVSSQSGIVDLCGFPKDAFYYLKSLWTDELVLHVFPHWNWEGREGRQVDVRIHSNCDEIELFLNDKSQGRKKMRENSHLSWMVDYAAGALTARGFKNGREVAKRRVETTGDPASIQLIPDRALIRADGEDVSIITVQLLDASGRLVPTADNEIVFDIKGPARIVGVGNGDPSSHEPDRYIDDVRQIRIVDMKMQTVENAENPREVAFDVDTSSWRPATSHQGEYAALDPEKAHVIRGVFRLPKFDGELSKITLYAKSLVATQAIYVNGQLIARDIKRDDPDQRFILDHAYLREGENVYAVVGPPLTRRFQYENLNTDAGIIQVFTPSERWRRSAFNGMAQVIVRSAKEPGEITLEATSDGLSMGILKLRSQPSTIRPAVPAL